MTGGDRAIHSQILVKEDISMLTFYQCNTCGNRIEMIEDSGVTPTCCGDDMEELIPGTSDGAKEKHIPIFIESTVIPSPLEEKLCTKVITVQVGETPHPMMKAHYIEWILVHTNRGVYRKSLDPSLPPEADFCLKKDETVLAIYAYCNLHGLWVDDIR